RHDVPPSNGRTARWAERLTPSAAARPPAGASWPVPMCLRRALLSTRRFRCGRLGARPWAARAWCRRSSRARPIRASFAVRLDHPQGLQPVVAGMHDEGLLVEHPLPEGRGEPAEQAEGVRVALEPRLDDQADRVGPAGPVELDRLGGAVEEALL